MSRCDFQYSDGVATCVRCGRVVRTKSTNVKAACRAFAGYEAENIALGHALHGSGPGTELKKLLAGVGITATPNCSCNARARTMDANGCEWCEAHLDEIVGWLREEATKRGLPFVDMAGRVLVKRAISNARKAEARRAKEAQPAESGPA